MPCSAARAVVLHMQLEVSCTGCIVEACTWHPTSFQLATVVESTVVLTLFRAQALRCFSVSRLSCAHMHGTLCTVHTLFRHEENRTVVATTAKTQQPPGLFLLCCVVVAAVPTADTSL